MSRRAAALIVVLTAAGASPAMAAPSERGLATVGDRAAESGTLPRTPAASSDGLLETTGTATTLTSSRLSFLNPGDVADGIGDLVKCATDPLTSLPSDPTNVITGPVEALGCAGKKVGGAAADAAGDAAGEVAGGIVDEWTKAVLDGTQWVLGTVAKAIDRSTRPDLTSAWFRSAYATMGSIALLLCAPLLFFGLGTALLRRDSGQAIRTAFVTLPMALVLSACAVTLTQLGIAITDWACVAVSETVKEPGGRFLADTAKVVSYDALVGPKLPTVVALGAGLLAFLCGVLVWLELIVRDAAVYLCAFFLPLAFTGALWARTAKAARRLVGALVAVVLSKFVIVAVLSLAGRAVFAGVPEKGIEPLLAAIAMLLLAVMAPATLLALVPLFDDQDGSHVRRGFASMANRSPLPMPREVVRQTAAQHLRSASGSAGGHGGPSLSAATAAGGVVGGHLSRNQSASATTPPTGKRAGDDHAAPSPHLAPSAGTARRVVDIAEGRGATAGSLRPDLSPRTQSSQEALPEHQPAAAGAADVAPPPTAPDAPSWRPENPS